MPNKLEELRGTKSLTEVAKAVDISRQMLRFIEEEKRTPSLQVAQRLADYYQTTIDSIFFTNSRNETLQNIQLTGTDG